MDEMWQFYMAMGTVLAAVVTAVAFGWRVSSAMRRENREAHAGIRTEIQTVREDLGAEIAGVRQELGAETAENRAQIASVRVDLGAEIAENREAIGGIREDLAAFRGHIGREDRRSRRAHRPPGGQGRQDRRGRGVHQGAPDRRGPGLSHAVARLVGRRLDALGFRSLDLARNPLSGSTARPPCLDDDDAVGRVPGRASCASPDDVYAP